MPTTLQRHSPLPPRPCRWSGCGSRAFSARSGSGPPRGWPPPPTLVIALHGSGGDGERFRRLTGNAFEALADEHGFLLAYPDGLGGQWNDCRAQAPYHPALSGIDEVAFLRAVVQLAQDRLASPLAAVFVVGFSAGGHLAFRLALEAPADFTAFAAITAHLPADLERACRPSGQPVSLFLVSGTEDPVNPWSGGQVRITADITFGTVLSAGQTAEYFRRLARLPDEPMLIRMVDSHPEDGTGVEIRRWQGESKRELVLMTVHGGGHALPNPAGYGSMEPLGRVSREVDGAEEIWKFFARHILPVPSDLR